MYEDNGYADLSGYHYGELGDGMSGIWGAIKGAARGVYKVGKGAVKVATGATSPPTYESPENPPVSQEWRRKVDQFIDSAQARYITQPIRTERIDPREVPPLRRETAVPWWVWPVGIGGLFLLATRGGRR